MKCKFSSQSFLLVGNGPYSNRGCEAIVRGTAHILSQRFDDSRFILSSFGGDDAAGDAHRETDDRIVHCPHGSMPAAKYSLAWWNYRVLHRRSTDYRHFHFRAQYEGIKQSVCALQIGGDNYSMDHGMPREHMLLDGMLKETGKPLVLWGASIGPPVDGDAVYEHKMMRHLRQFDIILARESKTVEYLASFGITENVKLVADPAFFLKPVEPSVAPEMKEFWANSPIGLNLSPIVGRFRADPWKETATECIKALLDSGVERILLVPHVTVDGGNDYEFMLQVGRDLPQWGSRVNILPYDMNAAEYKWVISKLPLFVGARTHSTIAAISSLVPTISIGYSIKSAGINQDIYGHTDWCIPIHQLTPEMLVEKVKLMSAMRHQIRRDLEEPVRQSQQRAQKAADHLIEVL
ncbi:MAG: polysaccharide pyruvyl transferase family protein [Armatimonadota bacterium]